jgi:hypothetical protein
VRIEPGYAASETELPRSFSPRSRTSRFRNSSLNPGDPLLEVLLPILELIEAIVLTLVVDIVQGALSLARLTLALELGLDARQTAIDVELPLRPLGGHREGPLQARDQLVHRWRITCPGDSV